MSEISKLSELTELEEAIARSHDKPLWIFKHSLICPISSRAWSQYREFAAGADRDEADFAVIEIQNARPVSAAATERTGVKHESPQAILLVGGRPVWDASHSGITARSLAEATARI